MSRFTFHHPKWCFVTCLESRLFVCNFCFSLHPDPLWYDSKMDLACMRDKSNCCVICTLFKITFPGNWDECPLLWTLTYQFPRSPHTLCAFCPVLSVLLLWTALLEPNQDLWLCDSLFYGWHEQPLNGGGCCSQYSCSIPFPSSSWYKYSQYHFHLSAICAASVKFSPVAD